MNFENLNLHPKILKAIAEAGYTEPTKIQLEAIPEILKGSDIRASAHTGTGKTAAFLLPALNRLATPSEKNGKGARVLILVPTRELAMQIASQAEKYSKFLDRIKTVCVVGGVPYISQTRKLSRPYDILIATPGRLIDFIEQRKIDFSRLEMLVLDEADRMLDMGFIEPVEQIVAATPPSKQTLMFSATLEGSVIKLSERLLKDPVEIMIHAKREKNENIEQRLHYVDDMHHKNRLLNHILSSDGVDNSIVFTSTKRQADQLADELQEKGYLARALHGDMNQRQRTRTIMNLRDGKIRILVATDVASRGIDVQSITHIINFDLPRNIEDYVHRIGRTGRAGAKGTALSFAAGRDSFLVKRIEQFTGQPINIVEIPGFEPRPQQQRPRGRPQSYRGGPSSSRGRSNYQRADGPSSSRGSPYSKRSDASSSDRSGPRHKRSDGNSSDRSGPYSKHADGPSSSRGGPYSKRSDGHSSDRNGPYSKRSDASSSDRSGPRPKRSDGHSSDRNGPYSKRSDASSSDRSGPRPKRSDASKAKRSGAPSAFRGGPNAKRSGSPKSRFKPKAKSPHGRPAHQNNSRA